MSWSGGRGRRCESSTSSSRRRSSSCRSSRTSFTTSCRCTGSRPRGSSKPPPSGPRVSKTFHAPELPYSSAAAAGPMCSTGGRPRAWAARPARSPEGPAARSWSRPARVRQRPLPTRSRQRSGPRLTSIDGPTTPPTTPIFGILAVADAVIVTGESISMITEACATGRPDLMFDFGGGPVPMRPPRPEPGRRRRLPWRWDAHFQASIYALYMQLPRGRLNRTRDLRLVHQTILASGRARWLGERPQAAFAPPPRRTWHEP
jgi:hypothetical protein